MARTKEKKESIKLYRYRADKYNKGIVICEELEVQKEFFDEYYKNI